MEKQHTTPLAVWHWHIEVSSKCTLRCPRCSREENRNSLINSELSHEFIERHFTHNFINRYVEKITFCGNDGDPIYARDFINIIKYFKSIKPIEINIVTNGSYKPMSWWIMLGKELTNIDTIHFSIDGWDQESNNKYRVNSDFESIMLGIKTLRQHSSVKIVWDTIYFSFNELHIDKIKNIARDIGCDAIQLTKSTKFYTQAQDQFDVLQPSLLNVSNTGRFDRTQIDLKTGLEISPNRFNNEIAKERIQQYKTLPITPLCTIGNKGVYISSQQRLYPCCWVANRYPHNVEWQDVSVDLTTVLLEDAIYNEIFLKELATFRWKECKMKCSSSTIESNLSELW